MLSRTITENDDLKYCITDSIMSKQLHANTWQLSSDIYCKKILKK